MEETKPWYASRIIWVNAVGLIAAVGAGFGFGLDAETQATIVGGILAVINILLRINTKKPVTMG